MINFERASSDRKINWLSLVGLVLVPLLVAGGFLWATWGSSTRLDRVQAAVVNLDKPVTINKQTVPLGRQLAGGLVTGGDTPTDQNFSWLLTDQTDAQKGLADGTYAAVVTIPENFSQQATSYSSDDPAKVSPAQINVATSGVGGITDNAIAQAISLTATSTLNTELTKQYLDQIYVGFNSTGEQFKTVAKAAGDLSDGTTKLADGIGKSADGARKLADGLDQLDTGGKQLATGATQLSTGTSQLATGLGKLATGTKALPKQTRKLADGTQQSADGAQQLADGVAALGSGTKLNAAGLRQYAAGLQDYRTFLARNADPKKPVDPQLLAAVDCPPQLQAVPGGCQAFLGGVTAGIKVGTGAAVAGLDDMNKQRGSVPSTPKACPSLPALKNGQQGGLLRGAVELCSGGGTLSSRVNGQLVPGTAKLAGGLDRLADGTDQLADGLKPLATGITSAATGATKLSTGASQLATGVSGVSGGITASATGAGRLADGLGQLDDGGTKLADGTKKLADGLDKGAEQVPTYDKTLRTRLAQTVATPVTQARPDSLFSNTALTSLLAVVALWLGGLASFLVLRAIPARTLTSMKPAWRLTLEALLPAAVISAVQGIVLAAIMQVLFHLGAGATAGLAALMIMAGLSFAALNQALVAWLGGVGRFLSVAAVVLTAAAATTSALPAALQGLVPFLPLTPALEGARAIATGADGAGGSAGMLLAWLLGGTVLSLVAVARRKQLPAVAALRPALT